MQVLPLVRPYKLDYSSTLRADRGITVLTAAAWAKKNGYRVVGCDSEATHAFLLQDGLGLDALPSIDTRACVPKVRAKGSAAMGARRIRLTRCAGGHHHGSAKRHNVC